MRAPVPGDLIECAFLSLSLSLSDFLLSQSGEHHLCDVFQPWLVHRPHTQQRRLRQPNRRTPLKCATVDHSHAALNRLPPIVNRPDINRNLSDSRIPRFIARAREPVQRVGLARHNRVVEAVPGLIHNKVDIFLSEIWIPQQEIRIL